MKVLSRLIKTYKTKNYVLFVMACYQSNQNILKALGLGESSSVGPIAQRELRELFSNSERFFCICHTVETKYIWLKNWGIKGL